MLGIANRLSHVICEVGTCSWIASHTEFVTVIPGDPSLRHERHFIDLVLCRRHDEQFLRDGLVGTITAHGDEITEGVERCH